MYLKRITVWCGGRGPDAVVFGQVFPQLQENSIGTVSGVNLNRGAVLVRFPWPLRNNKYNTSTQHGFVIITSYLQHTDLVIHKVSWWCPTCQHPSTLGHCELCITDAKFTIILWTQDSKFWCGEWGGNLANFLSHFYLYFLQINYFQVFHSFSVCVEDNLRTSILSFHYVDPNQIQVIRPRDKLP